MGSAAWHLRSLGTQGPLVTTQNVECGERAWLAQTLPYGPCPQPEQSLPVFMKRLALQPSASKSPTSCLSPSVMHPVVHAHLRPCPTCSAHHPGSLPHEGPGPLSSWQLQHWAHTGSVGGLHSHSMDSHRGGTLPGIPASLPSPALKDKES